MTEKKEYFFDQESEIVYDPQKFEIVGDRIGLKTNELFRSDDFVDESNEPDVIYDKTKIRYYDKNSINGNILFFAAFEYNGDIKDFNASYRGDSVVPTSSIGDIVRRKNFLSLPGSGVINLNYQGSFFDNAFPRGCLSYDFRFDSSEFASGDIFIKKNTGFPRLFSGCKFADKEHFFILETAGFGAVKLEFDFEFVIGQSYQIEVNWDIEKKEYYVFIDGQLLVPRNDSTIGDITANPTIFESFEFIGKNCSFANVSVYDDVQHTESYTDIRYLPLEDPVGVQSKQYSVFPTQPKDVVFYASYNDNGNPTDYSASWGEMDLNPASVTGAPTRSGGLMSFGASDIIIHELVTATDTHFTKLLFPNGAFSLELRLDATTNTLILGLIGTTIGQISNLELFYNSAISRFEVQIKDKTGTLQQLIYDFSLTVGQVYQVEFNWDISNNTYHFFVDGIELTRVPTNTFNLNQDFSGNRKLDILGVDCSVAKVTLYSKPQHDENFTLPVPVLQNFLFPEVSITFPDLWLNVVDALTLFQEVEVKTSSTFTYIISGFYFDGANWVSSDGTIAQSNDAATIKANLATLVNLQTLNLKVFITDSPDFSALEKASFDFSTPHHYQDIPSLKRIINQKITKMNDFVENAIKPEGTELKYVLEINERYLYFDGSNWVESDNTDAQATDAITIRKNLNKLNVKRNSILNSINVFFESVDGKHTPLL